MEDVDSLVVISLQELPFKHASLVKSINDLENPEILIPLTISMLNIITHSDIPEEIPLTLSAKYKLCMKLAELIKSIGYSSELNFNAFLYPNLKDIRKIISCLLENLPKEDAQTSTLNETSSQLYWKKFKETVKDWTLKSWKAPFDKVRQLEFLNILEQHDGSDLKPNLKEKWEEYQKERVPLKVRIGKISPLSLLTASVQINQARLLKQSENDFILKTSTQKEVPTIDKQEITESRLPSLIEVLERGNEKTEDIAPTFTLETEYTQVEQTILSSEEPKDPLEEKPSEDFIETETRQHEIDKLEVVLQALNDQIQENEAMIATVKAEMIKLTHSTKIIKTENEQLKKDLEQKHKLALALTEGSPVKIEQEIKDLENQLIMMEEEWKEYKNPLIEEIKEKENKVEKMKESYADKIEEIKQMKAEMIEIAEEAEIKEEILELLKIEDSKGTSSMNRSVFIKKITETITKIKTQNKSLTKIMKDITSMRKSVELSRESLRRVDSGTEDLVFQDAKKNSSSKVIYKLLVDLRENYDNLIRTVEEQCKIQTKINDFEIRIEAVLARNSKHDVAQLRADLEKIKSES